MFGRIFWKLFLGNAVLLTVMLITAVWLIMAEVDQFYQEELTRSLYSQAEMLRHLTQDRLERAHATELQRVALQIGRNDPAGIRATFIAADGTVLADSEAVAETMERHHDRREVRDALRQGWGQETRLSHTLGGWMKYVAVRVGPPDAPVGTVRLAMPLRTIGQRSESIRRLLWTIAAIALATALIFAMGLAWLWSGPIRRIMLTARSLSRGDLSARVRVTGHDELAALSRSLNEMRDHLAGQLDIIDHQRRILHSLLTQLREGVIVSDRQGRVVLMNPAAQSLLGVSQRGEKQSTVEGTPVEMCVPHHALQQMLLTSSGSSEATIHEVQVPTNEENGGKIALLVSAADVTFPASRAAAGEPSSTGRLLVLTDVTPLTRMMQIKADFAANASHELRTPLAGIRAAVETLLAMDPAREGQATRQFIEVIDRQSQRMQSMVSDLLNLSRIESSGTRFVPVEISIREMLAELRQRFDEPLHRKRIEWSTHLPEGRVCMVASPDLLRLVLENLIENAIKFTDAGGRIKVSCRTEIAQTGQLVMIEITDTGCGIPEEEQERVFERFYQVERARSGFDRGTGLGLSIVRHAVAAMHGTVHLRSRVGQGTSVTVTIPQTQPGPAPSVSH